jgi:RNA polymerase sigma-70 factor (ECF subfamily)
VAERGRADLQRHMTALARGDRAAFEPVYAALLPLLRAFAARLLPSVDAEDAAQEALIKIFARASGFDAARDATSWALAIAAYECLTVRRRAQRRRASATVDETIADGGASPEDAALCAELAAAVRALVGELAPSDRMLILAAVDGKRPGAGAAERKRLSRALARLRLLWRARHGE